MNEGRPTSSANRAAPPWKWIAWALALAGAALSLAALMTPDGRVRFAFGYLMAYVFFWTVALGSLFFLALHHLSHAVWSVVVRRVAEALAAPLGLLAVLFAPIMLFAHFNETFHLFEWMDAKRVALEPLLQIKKPYLNLPFFCARAILYFAVWLWFARLCLKLSAQMDRGRAAPEALLRLRRASAPFMILFAFTITFAGIDWLMSLEPRWYSTVFGIYIFSGMVVTGLSAITLTALGLRRAGRLGEGTLTPEHLYHLGTLLFAFVCFWAYIAFTQYMLIWYGNVPGESFFMVRRLSGGLAGGWLGVSVALAFARFVVPFLALLSSRAKVNPRVLAGISAWLLAGQLLDLYWLIMPRLHAAAPRLDWEAAGPMLLIAGLALGVMGRFLNRHGAVATGDPFLEASREYRV